MRSSHLSFLTGTAVALVLTAATTISAPPAAAQPSDAGAFRDPTMSRQKPTSQFGPSSTEGTTRNRTVAPSSTVQQRREYAAPQMPAPVAAPAPILTNPQIRTAPIISGPGAPAPVANAVPALPAPAPMPAPAAMPSAPAPVMPSTPVAETPVMQAPTPAPVVQTPVIQAPAVAEPVRSAAPAPVVSSNAPIADKLRELVAGKQLERFISRKNERDAVAAFYQNSRFQPLWLSDGAPNERARSATEHLKNIDADGLDPTDYPLPNLSARSVEGLAEAELKFTLTMLTYARHAMTGRVHFSRISPSIDYKDTFDPADVLRQLSASGDLSRTLDGFNPPQPAYKALKAKYAELRNKAETGPARIPQGSVLKYQLDRSGREMVMRDARVPMLRERLGLAAGDDRYDRTVADAVAKAQKSHGLKVDGQLTAATIDAINGPSRDKQINAVQATLERWRWVPRDLGRQHVMLNIPDYHLRVMNNGSQIWMTRVVVGKPTQATPLLTETMKFITVNPTWNVPQSIIYNELLPIYETSDPSVFDKMGLKVERKPDGDIRVFQPPGERNALGRIRFNFPNKFLVYQHDTPEKHYFAHDKRAYSHGCMRVQNPLKYAEVMLSLGAPRSNYSEASLAGMFGGEEKQIDFQHHIPVHITYQTAFVDDAGKLQFRDDVYGLDARYQAVVKGERAVADVAIERPADPNFKPTPEHRTRMQSAARGGGGGNPFALFEQLFR